MKSLRHRIVAMAAQMPEGSILSADILFSLGSRNAVDQSLSRLAKSGALMRVGRGLYVKPIQTRFGERAPDPHKVITSLALQAGETMVIGEAAAANALGLTTQVPMRPVYLSSGVSRRLQLGRQVVEIRHAPRWKLALANREAGTALRAMAWAGAEHAQTVASQLSQRMSQSQLAELSSVSTRYMPAWMSRALRQLSADG